MGNPEAFQSGMSRRQIIRAGGVGVVAIGAVGVLAACGSDSDSTSGDSPSSSGSTGSKDLGALAIKLSWIKNIEFAGEYFADQNGYYKDAGFSSVNLIAGGDQTTAEDALISGQALIGLSSPAITAPTIAKGAPLKIIGSTYQKNPFCLMSLQEKTPITTIDDLKGKKIGVQSGGNQAIFEGFLKANSLTTDDVEVVTTQYDIAPLEQGKYDAHFSYTTNEPILAKADGFTPVVFALADNGLPFVAETFTVTNDTLSSKRDVLKAFLIAEIKGWTDAVKDPAKSAELAVNTYGKDQKLDVTEQTGEATAQISLILTDDVNANGLFMITDELVQENIKSMAAMGTDIAADDLFDLSLIKEIYEENPDLKTQFTIPSA
ncbi:ABC transporter substrate-binding protein [Nocardioides sp. Kera G14]|uniref:ABC transporter substrate-binding protein n=1 Tax=Nocardioides sp. Kera G14 TaxID=2884264 RepID=UPI001D11CD46|nr:ABC transporter substrate-binding protein [Nocardioides sp. Kera G14]UDY25096.1 ABC transporter substrate-binding protein [Nocardioides sp. Kera G14]